MKSKALNIKQDFDLLFPVSIVIKNSILRMLPKLTTRIVSLAIKLQSDPEISGAATISL